MSITQELTAYFTTLDCAMPEIAILQPADPFLETAGEDLRRRVFITENEHGDALCLRPEFTIPFCLHHMANPKPRRYGYCGTVFRQHRKGTGEFIQAGIEDFGRNDVVAADVDCLVDAHGALAAVGIEKTSTILGDQAVFEAIVAALGLPQGWQTRLIHAFGDDEQLAIHLARLTRGQQKANGNSALDKLVQTGNLAVVEQAVSGEMNKASLPPHGGRTAIEIARRAIDKARLAAVRLDDKQATTLREFLDLDVAAMDAGDELSRFEQRHGLNLGTAKAGLVERLALLDKRGLQLSTFRYKASFGRRLDYYSGLLFEIYGNGAKKPVIGGGRYDRLMTLLGSDNPVPAVGFSIWPGRLLGAKS
jgi:ATP phosphoribosyltransferase regulatory subunit